jgi:uncharacterized membrane protein
LRFAIATTSTHGLSIHIVGVILMLAGVVLLGLSLLVGGWLKRHRNPAYSGRARTLVQRRTVY